MAEGLIGIRRRGWGATSRGSFIKTPGRISPWGLKMQLVRPFGREGRGKWKVSEVSHGLQIAALLVPGRLLGSFAPSRSGYLSPKKGLGSVTERVGKPGCQCCGRRFGAPYLVPPPQKKEGGSRWIDSGRSDFSKQTKNGQFRSSAVPPPSPPGPTARRQGPPRAWLGSRRRPGATKWRYSFS